MAPKQQVTRHRSHQQKHPAELTEERSGCRRSVEDCSTVDVLYSSKVESPRHLVGQCMSTQVEGIRHAPKTVS